MPERFAVLKRLKEKISKHVVVVGPQNFGIDSSFVLLSEIPPEGWEGIFKKWTPEQRLAIRPIIIEAANKTVEERTKCIEELSRSDGTVIIGTEARKSLEASNKVTQLKINFNSMSDENLRNIAIALDILLENK